MYHILVAVFDSETGKRITDAMVEATVSPLGLGSPTKIMNPWAPHDKINYCSWFRLSSKGTYVIQVSIRRPGTQVRTAEFTAKRFAG
jgi:hypothetical protein